MKNNDNPYEDSDLVDYLRPIGAYWRWIIVAVLLAVAAPVVYLLAQPPQYQSTAVAYVKGGYTTPGAFATLVEGTAYRASVTQLGDGYVQISGQAGTPERALEQVTESVSQAFSEILRTQPDYAALRDAKTAQLNQIVAVSQELTGLGDKILLFAPATTLLGAIYTLDAQLALLPTAVSYIRPATEPTEAMQPPFVKWGGVGFSLGLMLSYSLSLGVYRVRHGERPGHE